MPAQRSITGDDFAEELSKGSQMNNLCRNANKYVSNRLLDSGILVELDGLKF